jgi:hypothetical protein
VHRKTSLWFGAGAQQLLAELQQQALPFQCAEGQQGAVAYGRVVLGVG